MQTLLPGQVCVLTIDASHAGQRLDNFLIGLLKGVPKSHIYRIVRAGEVRINGKRSDVKDRIALADQIRIPPIRLSIPERSPDIPAAQKRPFLPPILFEDEHLIAINKPAGVAVHGGSGISFGIIEQLRLAREDGAYLELVHRLDRETSGVLLVAKTRQALLGLHAVMREEAGDQKIEKRYIALVKGRVANDRQHVKVNLLKYIAANNERRVRVDNTAGQTAHTIFNVLRRARDTTLVEAELKTGRTHQIRVHLAHLTHPIAGDDKYGDFEWNKQLQKMLPPLKRMFLHAKQLTFLHPVSEIAMTIDAPLPEELTRAVNATAWDAHTTSAKPEKSLTTTQKRQKPPVL